MAEGMLGGILGDEDGKNEAESPEPAAGSEAFAAAVAARLSGNDPQVARDTSLFLHKQAQLLALQAEHLKDEHPLRLEHLHKQLREESVRRLGMRLRVCFQRFVILVATVIGIVIAILIRDAVTSRRVVVEPFEVADNVAAPVPSGKKIARRKDARNLTPPAT